MNANQSLHCLGVLIGVRPAATQLSASETALLIDLASTCHVVAEIGVFEGVTSRRMIEQMRSGGTIYCFDPFLPGRLGLAYGYLITRSQVQRAKRKDVNCRIVRKLSYDFASEAPTDFDLIFIDADHSYEAVCRDWCEWSPKVRKGGYIALHDSIPVPGRCPETCGPVRLVKELGTHPRGFTLHSTADTLSVYQRVT